MRKPEIPSGDSSKKEIQRSRREPLQISKDSRKIRKPPPPPVQTLTGREGSSSRTTTNTPPPPLLSPAASGGPSSSKEIQRSRREPLPQVRKGTKVIRVKPEDFKPLVQALTGPSSSNSDSSSDSQENSGGEGRRTQGSQYHGNIRGLMLQRTTPSHTVNSTINPTRHSTLFSPQINMQPSPYTFGQYYHPNLPPIPPNFNFLPSHTHPGLHRDTDSFNFHLDNTFNTTYNPTPRLSQQSLFISPSSNTFAQSSYPNLPQIPPNFFPSLPDSDIHAGILHSDLENSLSTINPSPSSSLFSQQILHSSNTLGHLNPYHLQPIPSNSFPPSPPYWNSLNTINPAPSSSLTSQQRTNYMHSSNAVDHLNPYHLQPIPSNSFPPLPYWNSLNTINPPPSSSLTSQQRTNYMHSSNALDHLNPYAYDLQPIPSNSFPPPPYWNGLNTINPAPSSSLTSQQGTNLHSSNTLDHLNPLPSADPSEFLPPSTGF